MVGSVSSPRSDNYTRPELTTGNEISIKQGRHPVVERTLIESSFVPNDVFLSNDDAQLIVLTGPNMSGKSTYLRQVALIVLLAQIGSFVPADAATIGVVDRIFTRIGAGEDIAAGQSTFMVEMIETAKTLFATHYHEMVELASYLPRVKNFNVAVSEEGGEVTFLYKIVPGGVDKSYGIHVAQLAGLPKSVVHRAQEVLEELEGDSRAAQPLSKRRRKEAPAQQISFFGQKSPLLEELEKLDINSLTPLEALNKLYELKKKAGEG